MYRITATRYRNPKSATVARDTRQEAAQLGKRRRPSAKGGLPQSARRPLSLFLSLSFTKEGACAFIWQGSELGWRAFKRPGGRERTSGRTCAAKRLRQDKTDSPH